MTITVATVVYFDVPVHCSQGAHELITGLQAKWQDDIARGKPITFAREGRLEMGWWPRGEKGTG